MALKLYYHPLSSYCWKALIALYEAGIEFEPVMVNLGDPEERARLAALWPFTKFPVLVDEAGTWPEASIIIEHLAQTHAGARSLLPTDAAEALKIRLVDRIYDLYVHNQMQKIVGDRIQPPGSKDPAGVAAARATLATAYDKLEGDMASGGWASGETFTLVDCAAAPALFYGNLVAPFTASHPKLAAYLDRLKARPSFARTLKEAEPYFHLFPRE
jgi:glutathione S-transferase